MGSIGALVRERGLSERAITEFTGLARGTVRSVLRLEDKITLRSLFKLTKYLGLDVTVLVGSSSGLPEFSIVATAIKIERDGFESWKIHLMDFVDEFRRSLDPRLILLPPPSSFDPRLKALLASVVPYLCQETGISSPQWTQKRHFLETPWFPSGMQSLKAMAILESPLAFRRNNIFVHENFLSRA